MTRRPAQPKRGRREQQRTLEVSKRPSFAVSVVLYLSLANACSIAAPRFPSVPAWDDLGHTQATIEPDEKKLWHDAAESVAQHEKSKDHFENAALTQYLQGLVSRLTPPIKENGPKIRVYVNKSVESSAVALPDGTIVIALPLLVTFQNEAQLAFILAHEITHIVRRHALLSTRYDALTASHVERMRLSRRLEADADRIAVRVMSAAGYDPREAIPALSNVIELAPEAPHAVRAWNSHDYLPDRLSVIRRSILLTGSDDSELRAEAYQRAMDPIRLQAARLELESDRYDVALAIVTHHLERIPDAGRAYALRAQITSGMSPDLTLSDEVGADLERAVQSGPEDPDSLRALGLFLRDTGQAKRSNEMLRRYLDLRPDAFDRKLIERYLDDPPR